MKAIYRISRVLKIAGVVLILLSLVLGLYALINTGAARQAMNQGMARHGASGNLVDTLAFDRHFFGAMSLSSNNRNQSEQSRLSTIAPYFRRWFDRMESAVRAQEADVQKSTAEWLSRQSMDSLGLSAMEEQQESRELREIFEYIDGLSAPPKKGKVAALKAASLEPFFREYYSALSQEQGENAGTWYEFMSAVRKMIQERAAAGSSVKDVKAWMNDGFTLEGYQPMLEAVRTEEKANADSLSGALSALYERQEAGEKVDFLSFLQQTAHMLRTRYGTMDLGGESAPTLLAVALPELLRDARFDGSYGAVADRMSALAKADANIVMARLSDVQDDASQVDVTGKVLNIQPGVQRWEQGYLQKILAEADNRSQISVVSTFWKAVSLWVWLLLAGVLMIVLSRLIRWLMNRHLLKKRDSAGIREDADVLLRVEHLKQYFRSGDAVTKAVDDVSFFIKKGEVFGLVGESGCGKTTTGRTIINLYDPTEGNVYFDGLKISSTQNGLPVLKAQLRQDYRRQMAEAKKAGDQAALHQLKAELKNKLREAEDNALESAVEKSKCVQFYREKRLKELKEAYEADMKTLSGAEAEARTRTYETERKVAAKDNVMTRMQMIFQDPIASINPRMTVREIIAEGLLIRGVKDKEYINQKVYEMLELVGLVREHADRYPHEFSGGQRQRIGIARAIIMEPDLIIADEPISALDVSIQAQVINLLNDLRERMGLTIMFIAHNLSVVKYFSDRIAVMYFGRIVELATSDELFAHPLHPYTKSLLSAIPYPDPHYEKVRKRIEYVPAKAHDYSKEKPSLREITPGHYILCNEPEFQEYLKELGR